MNLISEMKPVDFGSYISWVSETFAEFPNCRLLPLSSPDMGKWQWNITSIGQEEGAEPEVPWSDPSEVKWGLN